MIIYQDIVHYWPHKHIETKSIEAEQVCEWRKGLCICVKKYYSSYNKDCIYAHDAYLINSQNKVLFVKKSSESGCCWQSEWGYCIERIFGGYYVALEGRCSAMTFPGKDRDTEYSYYKTIKTIITEDGVVLSYEQRQRFNKKIGVYFCKDIAPGIILSKNGTYNLHDYSPIDKLPDNVEVELNSKDGLYHVKMYDHYLKLYVIVRNKKIIRYFKELDFNDVVKLTNGNLPIHKKRVQTNVFTKRRTSLLNGINPIPFDFKITEVIKGYLYRINNKFGASYTNLCSDPPMLRGIYYGEYKNVWYEMNLNNLYSQICKMIELHFPVKNFITDIELIGNVEYQGNKCDLYLFDCKPYGIIDCNGYFHYQFDENNIKWY